jgi:hypothetical protein
MEEKLEVHLTLKAQQKMLPAEADTILYMLQEYVIYKTGLCLPIGE